MVAVINYGLGNVSSILNMLKKIGAKDVVLVQDPSEIKFADKLILPGVGAFDTGMKLLKQSGLVDAINIHTLENKKPILGICLGMQMLGCSSEEGKESGLGYLDFVSKKFDLKNSMLKVPHMGWDYVSVEKEKDPIVSEGMSSMKFYFVHSYHLNTEADIVSATTYYGKEIQVAAQKENVFALQFHPEKSGDVGLNILQNFGRL